MLPKPGASLSRIVLGMTDVNILSGMWVRTSSTTWRERLVRMSNMVITMPPSSSPGLIPADFRRSTFLRICPRPSRAMYSHWRVIRR